MKNEPELPYFLLPLEHERPTRRWGTYRAEKVVNVDGTDWAFRYLRRELYFTELPFVEGRSKIFLFRKQDNAVGELDLVDLVRDFLSLRDDGGSFCRLLRLWDIQNFWKPIVVSLSNSGNVRVEGGENGPFHDFSRVSLTCNEWAFSDPLSLEEHPILQKHDYFFKENEELEALVFEKIDWIEFVNTVDEWCVYFDERKELNRDDHPYHTFFEYENDVLRALMSSNIVSFDRRKKSDFSFDRLVSNTLKLEGEFWNSPDNCDSGVFFVFDAESQFEPFSYEFSDDINDHRLLYDPNFSNRLSNLMEIISDEFAVKGAGYYADMRQYVQLPFRSIEFGAGYTTKPSQHEKMEALLELKQWLILVDISEQDVELLLTDKLPKGWLSQQPKIRW